MSKYYYAQIDENDFLIGVSMLSGEVENESLIGITEEQYTGLREQFKKPKYVDGEWVEGHVVTLQEVKVKKKVELEQAYRASFTTFQSDATGELKTYPAHEEAQQNLIDYQDRLIADPSKDSFWFKTIEDKTLINHNKEQFLKLMEDGEMFKVNQMIKLNNLINQVDDIHVDENTTEEQAIELVEAIVWE